MSNSDDMAQLTIPETIPGLDVSVVDSSFRERAHAIGGLEASLPEGIYEVQFRNGPFQESQLIKLEAGADRKIDPPHLEPPSPAPVEGSITSHEGHQKRAIDASQSVTTSPGAVRGATADDSALVVMVRNVAGQDDLPFEEDTIDSIALVDPTLGELDGWHDQWQVDPGNKVATWAGTLTAGGYALQSRVPAEDRAILVDQAVWVSQGWQTLVFIPNTTTGPAPELATVHMVRNDLGWTPFHEGSEIGLAVESVLWGLRTGHPIVPRDLDALLQMKFTNPVLGVLGAHALLLDPESPIDRLDAIVENLTELIPGHPDVVALGYLADDAAGRKLADRGVVEWPPVLLASYKGLIRADASRPGSIAAGSIADRAAAQLLVRGLWSTWEPVFLPMIGGTRGIDDLEEVTIDVEPLEPDPATAVLDEYVTGAAEVQGVDREEILHEPVEQLSLSTGLPTAAVVRALDDLG